MRILEVCGVLALIFKTDAALTDYRLQYWVVTQQRRGQCITCGQMFGGAYQKTAG
jgi:hypothetical protein